MKRIVLCALLITTESLAVTYKWPYLASVDVNITGINSAVYTLHMNTATITDSDIGTDATVEDVLSRKGLSGSTFTYGGYHRHNNKGARPSAEKVQWYAIRWDAKWTAVTNILANLYGGGTRVINHAGGPNGNECVGTGVWQYDDTGTDWDWDAWPSRVWNGGVAGGCLGTPPVEQWCAMATPTIQISYGTIQLADAEGSKKTAGVTVECTTGMKYTLRIQDAANEISLDNGGRVTWQADGQAMGETLTGGAGENSVDLTATLHGPFERTGEFNGSGILFVSYP